MYVGCSIHLNILCLVTSIPTKVKIHGTSYYVIFYSLLFPVILVKTELLISKGTAMWRVSGVAAIGSIWFFCSINCKLLTNKRKSQLIIVIFFFKVPNFCYGWPLWLLTLGARNLSMPLLISIVLWKSYWLSLSGFLSSKHGISSDCGWWGHM